MKKTIIFLIAMLVVSFAWADREISATIDCNTLYVADAANSLELNMEVNSPDVEWLAFLQITFPTGVTPAATQSNIVSGFYELQFNNTDGQTATWGAGFGDTSMGYLSMSGNPYIFNVDVDIDAGVSGSLTVDYHGAGDDWGSPPHEFDATFMMDPALDDDLVAVQVMGNSTPTAESPAIYTIEVFNQGQNAASGFDVTLYEGDGNMIDMTTIDNLDPGATGMYDITWTPTEAGNTYLYGVVDYGADMNTDNNQTPDYDVSVQSAGSFVVTVGENTGYTLNYLPANFYWKNSLTESWFYPEEFGVFGAITAIQYFNNFLTDLSAGKPLKIWMGETTQEDGEDGWIPSGDLTLVFDDNVSLPAGPNDILITLDQPFVYTGAGNLVVYVNRPMDADYWSSSDHWEATDDPAHPNRSRYMYSDSETFDPADPDAATSSAYLTSEHANIQFFMNPEDHGMMEGYVYEHEGRDPLAGAEVTVTIDDMEFTQFTDATGYYYFPFLFVGNHSATVSLFGFYDTTEDITIEVDELTVQDFYLTQLPNVNVMGHVVTSDTGADVEGANVTLEGYENYSTVTGADGMFTIPGVYSDQTYLLTITYEGYQEYLDADVYVGTEDLDLGDLIVEEIAVPVYSIIAEEDHNGDALIVWTDPSGSFPQYELSYDDGEAENATGWYDEGNMNALKMTPLGYPCIIETGLLNIYDGTWPAGNILTPFQAAIYDDDGPDGMPGTELALIDVTPTDYNWVELDFTGDMVTITEGDFYLVHIQGGNYPDCAPTAIDETNPQGRSYSRYFTGGEDWAVAGYDSFMLRAIVRGPGGTRQMITETNEYIDLPATESKGTVSVNVPAMHTGLVEVGNANPVNTRVLESYNLHRLVDGDQENPDNWEEIATGITDTSYVDESWQSVAPGAYRYAVTAVYTNGVEADPGFSNVIESQLYTTATLNITTDDGVDPAGATCVLTNQDEDPEHVYTMAAPAGGTVVFPEVYLGVYDLTVTLAGYGPFAQNDINIYAATTVPVELNEVILAPINPMVEEIDNYDRLSWMAPGTGGWEEGFEGGFPPEDWAVMSPDGGTGWTQLEVGTTPLPGWTGGEAMAAPDGGDYMTYCTWDTGGGSSNDQWLVTPATLVTPGLNLSFYMVCWYASSYMDYVEILASTGSQTDPEDFTIVIDQITFDSVEDEEWMLMNYDLSEFVPAGSEAYIAFRETVDDNLADGAFVALDNVMVGYDTREMPAGFTSGKPAKGIRDLSHVPSPNLTLNQVKPVETETREFSNYNVYLDGVLEGTTTELFYDFYGVSAGTHEFGVSAYYTSGNESEIVTVEATVDAPDDTVVPNVTKLVGNYPNPFNPVTNISFSISEAANVNIDIYNIRGEKVKTLVDGFMEPSNYSYIWDGTDDGENTVASGVYFYKMKAGRYTSTKKMILMK